MSVTSIISNANSRVDASLLNASSYLNTLSNISNDQQIALASRYLLNLEYVVPSEITIADLADTPETLPDLTLDDESIGDLIVPLAPSVALDDYTWLQPTAFTVDVPTLNLPNAPTTAMPGAPSAPGAVRAPTLEAWRTYSLPAAPVLADETVAALSPLSLTDLSRTLPDITFAAPTNSFEYEEAEFSSELRTAIETLLLSDIEDGGYGIETTDEVALFERARDRETAQAAVSIAEVRRGMASRGFPLPTGALLEAERAAVREVAAALSGVNREIVLERSRLYVEARQFAVSQGLTWQSALLTYIGAKQERALRAATAVAEFGIRFFEAQVTLFNLRVSLKQLDRELHAGQLEQARTALEEFRLALERSQTLDARNESKIRQYTAGIEAIRVAYETQGIRDQRAQVEAEIERLKLELNAQQIQVYTAQVQARSDEYEAYATAVRAETLKLERFDRLATVHERQLASEIATIDATSEQYRNQIAQKEALVRNYTAQISEYETSIRRELGKIERNSTYNKDILTRWQSHLQAHKWNDDVRLQTRIAATEAELTELRDASDHIASTLNEVNKFKELKASAAEAALKLYEQQIAGAESSLSAIATLSEDA